MKLSIIGTGYVGLVTGTCFAEVGHHVICVDNDANKVKMLQGGGIPIYEPGLEEMVQKNVAAGRLRFTADIAEGVENSDVIFIAVPTPPQPDGSVDMSFIERVAREIAGAITSYKIVVDKSTVPVKTGEKVAETIKRYCKSKAEFDVVSNPEFLREGFAVEDLMKPDRVVVGVRSQRPVAAMKAGAYDFLSKPVVLSELKLLLDGALGQERMEEALSYSQQKQAQASGFEKLIGVAENRPGLGLDRIVLAAARDCIHHYDKQEDRENWAMAHRTRILRDLPGWKTDPGSALLIAEIEGWACDYHSAIEYYNHAILMQGDNEMLFMARSFKGEYLYELSLSAGAEENFPRQRLFARQAIECFKDASAALGIHQRTLDPYFRKMLSACEAYGKKDM